jgi:hypothetical protein
MKKDIWLRANSLSAKAAWVNESRSGIYLGTTLNEKQLHYSYHRDGRSHLAISRQKHFTHKTGKDTALNVVTENKNVGGFSVDPSALDWEKKASFGQNDLVIDLGNNIRIDIGMVISMDVCTETNLKEVCESNLSGGAMFGSRKISFISENFPRLVNVIHIQYQTKDGRAQKHAKQGQAL